MSPRDALTTRLEIVRARLRNWTLPELEAGAGYDSAGANTDDRASEFVARDLSHADRERLLKARALLVAALQRLDDGRFGQCMDCGGDVPPRRLDAMPECETCLECQMKRELDARVAGQRVVIVDADDIWPSADPMDRPFKEIPERPLSEDATC